jgi:uncharacterized damage-inducible protein DinB
MAMHIVTSEKTAAEVLHKLVVKGASRAEINQARARLVAANPHLDFSALKRGDVILVPSAPLFDAQRASSAMSEALNGFLRHVEDWLRAAKERQAEAAAAATREHEAVIKALNTAIRKDKTLEAEVRPILDAVTSKKEEIETSRAPLAAAFEKAQGDLQELRQRVQ